MPLIDLVAPKAIIPALKVNNKKQALQELAAKAAALTEQNERAIFEILMQREKLGSTGVGNGIAIPHGKLPKLGKLFGLFARLDRPIDFEALDGQPVDLIFLLLAPETAGADHLKALARVARLAARRRHRAQAARIARRRSALCGAGDAFRVAANALRPRSDFNARSRSRADGFRRRPPPPRGCRRSRSACRRRRAGRIAARPGTKRGACG